MGRGIKLLDGVIVTGDGLAFPHTGLQGYATFLAYGATSAGSGAATIKIQVTNIEKPSTNDWIDAGTITLTLSTTRAIDGFAIAAPWLWYRANLTAVSGTNATITAIVAV